MRQLISTGVVWHSRDPTPFVAIILGHQWALAPQEEEQAAVQGERAEQCRISGRGQTGSPSITLPFTFVEVVETSFSPVCMLHQLSLPL